MISLAERRRNGNEISRWNVCSCCRVIWRVFGTVKGEGNEKGAHHVSLKENVNGECWRICEKDRYETWISVQVDATLYTVSCDMMEFADALAVEVLVKI